MVDFSEYYVICRRHVPAITLMDRYEIAGRIGRHTTMTLQAFTRYDGLATTQLEFDGEFYWRVVLSDKIAPDGVKRLAFVTGGIRHDAIKFPRHLESPSRFVNAILNDQYKFHVRPIRSDAKNRDSENLSSY